MPAAPSICATGPVPATLGERPRWVAADTLRGVAVLLLVVYHVVGSNAQTGLRIGDGWLRQWNDALAIVRMPLFALLAGWAHAQGRSRQVAPLPFAGRQATRLLLPTLTVGTLFALLQSATPQANGGTHDWWTLHLKPVAHFWFLEALFWVLLAVHLLDRAGAGASAWRLLGAWAAGAALSLLWVGPRWLGLDGALYLLPYALMGAALSHPHWAARLHERRTRGWAWLVGLPCLALLWPLPPDPDRRQPAMLLASTCLCLLLMARQPRQAHLAWLGRQAYALFLFHPFFTAAARIAFGRWPGLPLAVQVVGGVAAGVAGSVLLATVLRRWGWTRLLLLGQASSPARA